MLYRFSMRILPRSTGVALAALATLLLSGCLPSTPVVTPEPLPSSTPVFASDADALAAATDAYRAYVEVSDQIARDGGVEPERLSPLVTPEWLAKEVASFNKFAKLSRHQTGSTSFRVTGLQGVHDDGHGGVSVGAYVCTNVSGTRFLDASGTDVTPADRVSRVSLEVTFKGTPPASSQLVLARNEPWSGTGVC